MHTVAIVGVGLIGGSFGLALRKAGFQGELIGVSSQPAIEEALSVGAIDRSASLSEAAASADLIYLAQPVDRILTTIGQLGARVKPDAIVTDAGSTKQAIVLQAMSCLQAAHFIGGHPMAGKEQRGAQAADADLFRDRSYILTPHLPATAAANEFKSWLERIGCRVFELSAEEHDRTVAFSSHLPQILSSALALALNREGNENTRRIFGPGLLDMTRLAMSSAELWNPILSTNRPAVASAIDAFRAALNDLQLALENDTLMELFEVGSGWAKRLRQ